MSSAALPPAAAGPASGEEPPPLFDALLTPHRSLSPRGFALLMIAVCAVSFTAGLAFFLMGAWPVVGFMGLDVALIYGAFRINYRRARMFEQVVLTRDLLVVRRVDPRGGETRWAFQPYWLQVRMDDPPEPDSRLTLRSHGKSLAIGDFLSPAERLSLAKELQRHLATCRCAPFPLDV
jgi:uncharacterized membrane protein